METKIRTMSFQAMIAAIYFICCFFQQDFASGAIQCRFSESLCLIPIFFPNAILGLTIGCLLWNLIFGVAYDIIFGTLATFIAAVFTCLIGKMIKNEYLKIIVGGLPPVFVNAIVIPFVIIFGYQTETAYLYLFLTIALGQIIAVYGLGVILYFPLKKLFKRYNLN